MHRKVFRIFVSIVPKISKVALRARKISCRWKKINRSTSVLRNWGKSLIVPRKLKEWTLWSSLYFCKHKNFWFCEMLEAMYSCCFSDLVFKKSELTSRPSGNWNLLKYVLIDQLIASLRASKQKSLLQSAFTS